MIINNKDTAFFNCKCVRFTPTPTTYKNKSLYASGDLVPFKGENIEDLRKVHSTFVFYGTKELIQKNISRFIEEVKYSIIKIGSFFYEVNIGDVTDSNTLTNNSYKLNITFDLLNMYEVEKKLITNSNTTININSPKPCYANLEISAKTNVISCIVKINDTEITVNNIKGGETIYIGSGKVIAGGKSKMNDVDMWEFPKLNPGSNKVSVNREDVNLTIKYCERW